MEHDKPAGHSCLPRGYNWIFLVFLAIAGFFLFTEHRAQPMKMPTACGLCIMRQTGTLQSPRLFVIAMMRTDSNSVVGNGKTD